MKKHIVFAAITLVLLLVVIYFLFLSSTEQDKKITVSPTLVEVAVVSYHNIPVTAKSTGQLVAPNFVNLKSQIAGIVEKINFSSGQYVEKGQVLILLNNTQQSADMSSTLADYTQAKAQYERTSTLFTDNQAVSQSVLDNAKADYIKTKAEYDASLYQLSNTKITAPFSGFLTVTEFATGSYVSLGDSLVGLVDKENLELQYALAESYAKSMAVGQVVNFTSDAFPTRTFHAKVSYISPNVSQDNLTFTIRAKFDNKNNILSPGMSVYVSQILKDNNMVLAVPESALRAKSGGFIVYTIDQNKAKAVTIKIGQINRGYVTVLSGLTKQDKVITAAQNTLSDGLSVKVKNK